MKSYFLKKGFWLTLLILLVPRFLVAQAPNWSVDPNAFSNNMNVIGFLQFNKVESADVNDMVAAFVGDEVRGVASPIFQAELNRYVVFLTVYSNTSAETITFKAYDASADSQVDVIESVTFVADGLVGGLETSFIWSDVALSAGADLTAYTLPGQIGDTQIDGTNFTIEMGLTTDLSSLVGSFTISDDATARIGDVVQVSGQTTNNFSSPITLNVQSENGLNLNEYTIEVVQINSAPSAVTLSASTVTENNTTGIEVGEFTVTDDESNHTLTLVSGTGDTDNSLFQISGSKLLINTVSDFEVKAQYAIRVRVEDSANNTLESTFTINVNDVNDQPTDISLSNSSINENNDLNQAIGSLTTTDQDSGDSHTYSLVSGAGDTDNTSFSINGNNELIAGVSFDFETKSSFSVRVKSTDGQSASFEKSFTISVNNINESSTGINISTNTIAENNAANASIGTFSTVDTDEGSEFAYTLVNGAGDSDNALFQIESNVLKAINGLDFESKATLSVRVRSTDTSDDSFIEGTFEVVVTDANDVPTDMSLSASEVTENAQVNSVVATISTTDEDAGDAHIYSLASGTGDGQNGLFAIRNTNELVTTGNIDFETNTTLSVRIVSVDQMGARLEKSFLLTVLNQDEPTVDAPQEIQFEVTEVDETSQKTLTVGNTGTDGDLSITDVTVTGPFSVDRTTETVSSGSETMFTITFAPTEEGDLQGSLTLVTNAGDQVVDLKGTASNVTGFEELPDFSDKVKLWPNPVRDIVTIDTQVFKGKPFQMEFYSIADGKIANSRDDMRGDEFRLDVGAFSKGLYLLLLHNQDIVVKKKLMVLK